LIRSGRFSFSWRRLSNHIRLARVSKFDVITEAVDIYQLKNAYELYILWAKPRSNTHFFLRQTSRTSTIVRAPGRETKTYTIHYAPWSCTILFDAISWCKKRPALWKEKQLPLLIKLAFVWQERPCPIAWAKDRRYSAAPFKWRQF
jgi:hypothetical protein